MAARLIELGEVLPNFKFRITLDSVLYVFSLRFNYTLNRWILDILDANEDNVLVGIPVLLKTDLIQRFPLGNRPPGRLIAVNSTKNQNEEATVDTLGKEVFLFYEEAA